MRKRFPFTVSFSNHEKEFVLSTSTIRQAQGERFDLLPAFKLQKRKIRVPDLAMTAGFSDETNIFKVLALGAPNFKAVCMGRALMIPGMVGKSIGEWIKAGTLPETVSKFGSKADKIFVSYKELKAKFGKNVEKLPLGAVGIYTASQKIRTGLQLSRTAPSTSRRSRGPS